jgi:hypothetical protein
MDLREKLILLLTVDQCLMGGLIGIVLRFRESCRDLFRVVTRIDVCT